MNYGRFFELDINNSVFENGVVLFNYRWLELNQLKDGINTIGFPVYLTFTPESVIFNLHYIDNESDRRHYHNTIIELPFSQNCEVSNELSEALNDTYSAPFPVSVNTTLREVIGNSYKKNVFCEAGYSCLVCFEPEVADAYSNGSNEDTHFLRKIILDFLYDLEFSDIFKNIPFYDRIYSKFKENFLFNALMNKTRYYYYRSVLNKMDVIESIENVENGNEEGLKLMERKIRSFVELYAKAEQDWVNSILDKHSMQQFHESPWFEESNVELEQVYWSKRINKWKLEQQDSPGSINEIEHVPEQNKPSRNSLQRKKYLHKIGADKDSFCLTVNDTFWLANIGLSNREKSIFFKDAERKHRDLLKESAKWEVIHYHFGGLTKIWCGNVSTITWSIILSIPIIFVIAVWLWYISKCNNPNEWYVLMSLLLIGGLIYCMKEFTQRVVRHSFGLGAWNIMMPRLLAAIIAAWFTMSMTDALFGNFANEPVNLPAIIILFLSTLLFVGYESRQLNPFDTPAYNILSSVVLIIIAYFYSFVVGIMMFDFFGEKMLRSNAANVPCMCSCCMDNNNIIFNKFGFVFQFSFLATFIGIFINLMFKGKPVTDSNN